MTTTATAPAASARVVASGRARLVRAAARVAVLVGLYRLYAVTRDAHGGATAHSGRVAHRHAEQLVAFERALGLPSETVLQSAVLPAQWLVRLCGAFYGTAHFVVTVAVLLVLAVRRTDLFDRLAGTLALSTFAGVACFALYPVAPPRLIGGSAGTVDTLATIGGVVPYDHGVLEHITDPYAALPSLHLAWATWCGLVLWQLGEGSARRRLWRELAVAYPLGTLTAVLVTGNHWLLDAVAGTALVLAVRGALALALQRAGRGRAT